MLNCWDGLTSRVRWDRAQVVGWPPIRSYRKNTMATNPPKYKEDVDGKLGLGCLYVKVSMEGAPYLRKVDLKTYKDYRELSSALEKMFSCFTIGEFSGSSTLGSSYCRSTHMHLTLQASFNCVICRNYSFQLSRMRELSILAIEFHWGNILV